MNVRIVILDDAHAMHILHKSTFQLPSYEDLSKIKIGDFVKVCFNSERFWCEIIEMKDGLAIGRIDNDLVQKQLKLNELIEIKSHNIYSIMLDKEKF